MKIIPASMKNWISKPARAEFVENTIIAVGTETTLKMIGRPAFIFVDKQADAKKKKYSAVKEFLYQATCLGLYFTIAPSIKKGFYKLTTKILNKNPENAAKLKLYEQTHDEIVEAAKLDKSQNKTIGQKFKAMFIDGENVKAIKDAAKDESEIYDVCEFSKHKAKDFDDSFVKTSIDKMKMHKKNVDPKYITDSFNKVLEKAGKPEELKEFFKSVIKKVEAQKFGKGAHEFGAIFGSVLTLAIIAPELSHFFITPIMKAFGLEKKTDGAKH